MQRATWHRGLLPGASGSNAKEQTMRKETTRWRLLGAAGALALGFGMSTSQASPLVQGNSGPKVTDHVIQVAGVTAGADAGASAGVDADAASADANAGADANASAGTDTSGSTGSDTGTSGTDTSGTGSSGTGTSDAGTTDTGSAGTSGTGTGTSS